MGQLYRLVNNNKKWEVYMSLVHCFSIIENEEKIEKVDVPDALINYIKDSILWIVSMWNGKKLNNGLPYYGEALIEGDEIVKFKMIMKKWRELFALATEEIRLTGNFLIDDMEYEKIIYKKSELLEIMDNLIQLCNKAETMKYSILFEGI